MGTWFHCDITLWDDIGLKLEHFEAKKWGLQ